MCAAIAVLFACSSGRFKDGVFSNKDVSYRVGPYPSDWQVIKRKKVNVALEHASGGGLLIINSRCGKGIDESLDVLINDLFLEVNHTEELSRETLMVDGVPALRVQHQIVQKVAQTKSDTVLLKEGACAFWFQLVAKPAAFGELDIDFVKFYQGFARISGK